jgi:hypothetical protein
MRVHKSRARSRTTRSTIIGEFDEAIPKTLKDLDAVARRLPRLRRLCGARDRRTARLPASTSGWLIWRSRCNLLTGTFLCLTDAVQWGYWEWLTCSGYGRAMPVTLQRPRGVRT